MLILAGLAIALLAGPGAGRAYAAGTAANFVVDASVAKDGTLKVEQTVTFAGSPPAELRQRFETLQNLVGDRQYAYTLSDFTATAGRASVATTVDAGSRFTTVTLPTNGASEVTLSYTVRGAVVNTATGTALRWSMLQGLSATVNQFEATVQIPTIFDYVRCTAGAPNSTTPCAFAAGGTQDSQVPTFRDGPRGEGEVVAVDIGFANGAVAASEQIKHRWTVGRAFSTLR